MGIPYRLFLAVRSGRAGTIAPDSTWKLKESFRSGSASGMLFAPPFSRDSHRHSSVKRMKCYGCAQAIPSEQVDRQIEGLQDATSECSDCGCCGDDFERGRP